MRILFLHQNFPGQFKHLIPHLLTLGHEVRAICAASKSPKIEGVIYHSYKINRTSSFNIHPWLSDFESKTIRAEGVYQTARALKADGYTPEVIIAHPGWGESLFIKEVWPNARLGLYCEYYYRARGQDIGFDSAIYPVQPDLPPRLVLKNLHYDLQLEQADIAIAPTQWQASTFPEKFQHKIEVIHDGIDTRVLQPNHFASITLNDNLKFDAESEVITFVSRNLEPYRGYHVFMRALPEILARRPNAHVMIVGSDGLGYGGGLEGGGSWRQKFYVENILGLAPEIRNRIHFLGQIPYSHYVSLLQLSSLHIYLTYPFVLSWSLLEAMSVGCPVLVSDTEPLQEVVLDRISGEKFDFFNHDNLANQAVSLLKDSVRRRAYGDTARKTVQQKFDLHDVCLPKQIDWVNKLKDSI